MHLPTVLLALWTFTCLPITCVVVLATDVDFRRDVEPVLRKHCYDCHGDEEREAGLRLTNRRDAFAPTDSGVAAIIAGDAKASTLIARITSRDPDDRMPPEGDRLSESEIKALQSWIDTGADWPADTTRPKHWAYVAPKRPALPVVKNQQWSNGPIDAFILAQLETNGFAPQPPADKARLLRRVSLLLTGLPPSIADIDRFLNSTAENAYEREVDRLLKSQHYGERWGQHWLDLARYADSNGFQADQLRDSWAYRDWVIDAINRNMPFNQFVVEQLAGDLLPGATIAQKIATGFHRTVTCNVEAGVHPEENRVNQVFDRVNTTGMVFLGTTLECAQCHNHKYDPFTQEEYYQLFAYFNNTPLEVKQTSGVTFDFIGPQMELPTESDNTEQRTKLQQQIQVLQEQRKQLVPKKAKKDAKTKQVAASDANKQKRKKLDAQITALQKKLKSLDAPTTLVMIEMEKPRETNIMLRGNYLSPGSTVTVGAPAELHLLDEALPKNRLGLARWLTSTENPLLARVTVNRWWAELFGNGLVRTPEDFGTQSDPPTHPQLLDWLAVEFMDSGWDVKHIHKQMVMSAAFRQSSRVTSKLLEADPDNKLYARGPRFRLSAESVRDNSLAISGLLSTKMGGPPVMPYQPANVWRAVGRNAPKWKAATDENRFRRGVYVVWRRAAPYPSFVNFDAPDRAACVVQRPRTNTPLQALTLLNDPAYAEMALALAYRMANDVGTDADLETQISYGFRRTVTRLPSNQEVAMIRELYDQQQTRMTNDPTMAKKLIDGVIGYRPPTEIDATHLASLFFVANVLLNLDETITP